MDGIQFARELGWFPHRYSQGVHSPKGGVTIKGTFYPGGQFIPGDVVAQASPDVKQKLQPTREGMEAVARKDKEYTHADEKELPDDFRARVKALRLPPAWTGVQVSSDPNSDLQAIGYDEKGRVQYRYSDAHNKRQAAAKFERVKKFVGQLGNIRKQIDTTLSGAEGPDKEAAAVLALIDKTGFRVGSDRDTKAAKRAHGATTLDASHVSVNGDSVTFSFTGKKGVDIKQTVKSPSLAALIAPRKARGGRLFNTTDGQVRDYLHRVGGKFKVKDFRTAVAADTAMTAIKGLQAPKTEKEYKLRRAEVGKIVAEKLGNTPTVALASYIPPEVFASWQANLISQNPSAKTLGNSSKPAATQKTSTGRKAGGTPTKQPTTRTTKKPMSAATYGKKDPPKKTSGGWITIGGDKSAPPGEKGGTRVYIEDGKIIAGPRALEGRKLSNLSKPAEKSSAKKPSKQPPKPGKKSSQPKWDISLVTGQKSKIKPGKNDISKAGKSSAKPAAKPASKPAAKPPAKPSTKTPVKTPLKPDVKVKHPRVPESRQVPAENPVYMPPKKEELTDEEQILLALSDLPGDEAYSKAMHRYMNGRDDQRDKRIITARRLNAIQKLRDGADTDEDWKKWASIYMEAQRGLYGRDGSGIRYARDIGWDILFDDKGTEFARDMGWVERYTEHAKEGGETILTPSVR